MILSISILLVFIGYPLTQCEVIYWPTITAGNLVLATDIKTVYDGDEDRVAYTVCRRTFDERMQLQNLYNKEYCSYINSRGEPSMYYYCDLNYRLGELSSGQLDKLYDKLLLPSEEILATALRDLIQENGKNRYIVEIACAEDNPMKRKIKEYLIRHYSTTLEQLIGEYQKDDRPYQEAMLKYCVTERHQHLRITDHVAVEEANSLRQIDAYNDKEAFKTKLKQFLDKHSDADMKLIFQKYREQGDGIDIVVEGIFEGYERDVYSALVRYIENPCKYYADALHDCMDGWGTNEERINRIVVTRCERDLGCIHNEYSQWYKETYTNRLKHDTREKRWLECVRYLSGKEEQ